MRIEIAKNKVFLKLTKKKLEIHPLWLRERARLNTLHDKYTDQRLYDPSKLKANLKIKKASLIHRTTFGPVKSNLPNKSLINQLQGM